MTSDSIVPPSGSKGLSAIIWQYAGNVGRAFFIFLFGILLARLLGPVPFATVVVAQAFISLASLISDFGMSSALIQRKNIDSHIIGFIFTFQMLISLALSLAFAILSPIFASVFKLTAWEPLAALSLIFLVNALGQTSAALLRRELRFKELNIIQLAAYLIGYGIFGIFLALQGAGVWALVVAQLCQALVASLAYLWRIRPNMKMTIYSNEIGLIKFSSMAFSSNLVSWCISGLPTLLIGNLYGPNSLALYNRAAMTGSVPLTNIVAVLQSVLLSVYSRQQQFPARMSTLYVGSLGFIGTAIFPFFGILAVLSTPLSSALFGSKWIGIEALMIPLLLMMPFDAIAAISSPLLVGYGVPQRDFQGQLATLIVSAILVSAIILFADPTLKQLVIVISISVYLLRALLLILQVRRVIRVDDRLLIMTVLYCASITMLGCLGAIVGQGLASSFSVGVQLGAGSVIGVLVWFVFVMATRTFWQNSEGVRVILKPITVRWPQLTRIFGEI